MGHDRAGIKTDLRVERWDADQVDWAMGRLGIPGRWYQHPNVEITREQFRQLGVTPSSVTVDRDCNLVTQNGWVALIGGVAGTTITNKFSSTFGRIGAGTINTTATYADTKLGGDTGVSSTTSYYQLCGVAPTLVTATTPPSMTFQATFGTGVANFAWNEFGIDNGNASGVTIVGLANTILFDHGISAQGTKISGNIWTATAIMTAGFPSGTGAVS